MRKHATTLAAVASALVLSLSACSSSPEESPAEPEETVQTESTSPDPEADDLEEKMDEEAGPDAEDIPVDDELDVIATRDASFNDHDVVLDLNRVKVSGELMSVMFTVTNDGERKWQIASSFDSGEYRLPLSDDEGDDDDEGQEIKGGTVDGMTVTDNENGMVYRVAYDEGGNCLCSSNLSSSFLDQGKSLVLTAKFAAPPEDVETVTVDIPHFGSFDDVPLTR